MQFHLLKDWGSGWFQMDLWYQTQCTQNDVHYELVVPYCQLLTQTGQEQNGKHKGHNKQTGAMNRETHSCCGWEFLCKWRPQTRFLWGTLNSLWVHSSWRTVVGLLWVCWGGEYSVAYEWTIQRDSLSISIAMRAESETVMETSRLAQGTQIFRSW